MLILCNHGDDPLGYNPRKHSCWKTGPLQRPHFHRLMLSLTSKSFNLKSVVNVPTAYERHLALHDNNVKCYHT
jgi:hypothetical protein